MIALIVNQKTIRFRVYPGQLTDGTSVFFCIARMGRQQLGQAGTTKKEAYINALRRVVQKLT